MNCKDCQLNNEFWTDVKSDETKQRLLLKLFYSHQIDFSCLDASLKLCSLNNEEAIKLIFELLEKFSINEILELVKEDFTPFNIEAKDIPQFSNFDDCYYNVISALIDSGVDKATYEKMGYFLRNNPRKLGADKKYGENHAKTAAMMGLCNAGKNIGISPTPMGVIFNSLSKETKENIKPKLCLYIPFIQNYFAQDMDFEKLYQSISILSESTQKRRMSNINHLICIITNSIDHELYGH